MAFDRKLFLGGCPTNVPQAAFKSYAQLFKNTLTWRKNRFGEASAISVLDSDQQNVSAQHEKVFEQNTR